MNPYFFLKTKLKKLQAIVFDMDDTLYLEQEYTFSGYRAVSDWAEKNLGFPADASWAKLRTLFQQGIHKNTFDQWLAAHDPTLLQFVPKLVEIYREHEPTITPFPEVPQLLASLKPRYRLGLLSDGYLTVQERKLKALRLADWFDVVIFTDRWGAQAWKPNPFCFQSLLEDMHLTGSECMYVGDNPMKDFSAAKRLGMATVRLRHPSGLHTRLEANSPEDRPDFEIQNLNQLEDILMQWESDSTNP